MSDYTVLRRAILAALADVDPLELRDTGIDLWSEYELEADYVVGRARPPYAEARIAAHLRASFAELMETELEVVVAHDIAQRAISSIPQAS